MGKRVVIFSAPSGAGKSTIVGHLLKVYPEMEFSISATSRAPRGTEVNGKEYYFLSKEEFESKIAAGDFVEYEEVYKGSYYGTLKSEVSRILDAGHIVTFDVDVKGGISLKKIFGDDALAVFIMAPSLEVLRERLVARVTDSPEASEARVAKAAIEMEDAPKFDVILINDDLQSAFAQAEALPIFGKEEEMPVDQQDWPDGCEEI